MKILVGIADDDVIAIKRNGSSQVDDTIWKWLFVDQLPLFFVELVHNEDEIGELRLLHRGDEPAKVARHTRDRPFIALYQAVLKLVLIRHDLEDVQF